MAMACAKGAAAKFWRRMDIGLVVLQAPSFALPCSPLPRYKVPGPVVRPAVREFYS
ncbi:hypothetical protein PUNSTDRAFT_115205 [Punctularia strigosozonata HHB-11173 SS5]|uniref:uncharacterized protein n=1 Tax=Punctularia strigosozonata (strain HHB-11173) TaxID=741275 RepID=UPI0004416BC0|nr:uncharacterized protein PUNSTDRAFT_115205 [Punctularia strigosozonata HHB-11173 SS5]EIN06695.1 hypothetical protein PUNSTDRAFT_115205 [Punctularia strigosozonata HHB-11173 SS5]